MTRRLSLTPPSQVAIICDNPIYPTQTATLADITLLGKARPTTRR